MRALVNDPVSDAVGTGETVPMQRMLIAIVGFQWLAAALDPHGYALGARFFALFCSLAAVFWVCTRRNGIGRLQLSPLHKILIFIYIVGIPIYGTLIALVRGGFSGEHFRDTSYIAAGVLFTSSLMYSRINSTERLLAVTRAPLLILAMVIPLTYVAAAFDATRDIAWAWVEIDSALIGVRSYGDAILPYIYFYASPMLFIALSYYLWKFVDRQSLAVTAAIALITVAIFLSGTRANQLGIVLCVVSVFFWRGYSSRVARKFFCICLIFLFFGAIYYVDILLHFFNTEDTSTAKKIGYLLLYDQALRDPKTLIFGEGFNAGAWSTSSAAMLQGQTRTELTYLEFLRVFGMPMFVVWVASLVITVSAVTRFKRVYQWLGPAMTTSAIISLQNPYIFSTNGMLLIALIASVSTIEHRGRRLRVAL